MIYVSNQLYGSRTCQKPRVIDQILYNYRAYLCSSNSKVMQPLTRPVGQSHVTHALSELYSIGHAHFGMTARN